MKYSYLFDYLTGVLPFQKKSSADWIVPASIGLGLGAAIGVGIGMLFAPAAGVDTRRQLKDASYRAKEKAFYAATQAKEKLTHQLANNHSNHVSNHIGEGSYVNDMGEIR